MQETHKTPLLPRPFIKGRLHSLTGFFLILFLLEHLFVNSQAALFIGDDGKNFIASVNSLNALPYIPVIELTLLGVPILVHGYYGIVTLFTSQPNSFTTDGRTPSLREYPRNHAYTWQRITALILVVGLFLHVLTMRFLDRPKETSHNVHPHFTVTLTQDPGLESVSKRLGVTLQNSTDKNLTAISDNFGTALLMMVRDSFKSVWVCLLYTAFVFAACFHGLNGLWTFAISWGISLTAPSQRMVRRFSNIIMALLLFFGLAAIWGTYFINLRQ